MHSGGGGKGGGRNFGKWDTSFFPPSSTLQFLSSSSSTETFICVTPLPPPPPNTKQKSAGNTHMRAWRKRKGGGELKALYKGFLFFLWRPPSFGCLFLCHFSSSFSTHNSYAYMGCMFADHSIKYLFRPRHHECPNPPFANSPKFVSLAAGNRQSNAPIMKGISMFSFLFL